MCVTVGVRVSVYCKPTSNLCNLFCDELPYFMQFMCYLCSFNRKANSISLFNSLSFFIFPFFSSLKANSWTQHFVHCSLTQVITFHVKRKNQIEFLFTNSFQFTYAHNKFTHFRFNEIHEMDSQSFLMNCQFIKRLNLSVFGRHLNTIIHLRQILGCHRMVQCFMNANGSGIFEPLNWLKFVGEAWHHISHSLR